MEVLVTGPAAMQAMNDFHDACYDEEQSESPEEEKTEDENNGG